MRSLSPASTPTRSLESAPVSTRTWRVSARFTSSTRTGGSWQYGERHSLPRGGRRLGDVQHRSARRAARGRSPQEGGEEGEEEEADEADASYMSCAFTFTPPGTFRRPSYPAPFKARSRTSASGLMPTPRGSEPGAPAGL